MFSSWSVVALFAPFVRMSSGEPTLTAELDYGTFTGAYSAGYNICYWQNIPFAAPPVGQNRFRAPQPPDPITNGTYNSTQSFDMCPQRTVNGSEDCLFLGLYSRPWTAGQSLRPVVVVFYGGGFIEGDAYFTIPPPGYPILNVSDANDFIFVYPNYRVNAFGFLPGKEIAEDHMSDLNPGLLDQHAALQWTNKHIAAFGGDASNVSIWGQSAGAGSVVAQVIAQDGRTDPPLFSKALASSPYWSKTYNYDAPEAQALYDKLANMTDCAGSDSLQCLKSIDVQTIRTVSLAIAASQIYNTSSYSWSAVIDGTVLTQPLSSATANGRVNVDYGFGVYNQHEGENFIPSGLQNPTNSGSPPFNSSVASFNNWISGYLPGLSTSDLETAKTLYPLSGASDDLPIYNTTYVRAGLIYRDTTLACPAYWTASVAKKSSYLAQYTISPAKHGSDTEWVSLNHVQDESETKA